MTGNPQPLDLMAIEVERRQTRPLAIKIELGNADTGLDDDYMRVATLEGQESVNELYQFNVEVHANDHNSVDVTAQPSSFGFAEATNDSVALVQGMGGTLLGKWAQLRVALPYDKDRFTHLPMEANPDWEDKTPSRFFGGIITSVTHGTPGAYQLVMQSVLYPLTLRNRYFIYKDLTIEALLMALLSHEILTYHSHFKLLFKLDYSTITRQQDWLQAGESDFEFLKRVLAKAAIHFYFIHDADALTLVFSNQATSKKEVAIPGHGKGPLKLRYSYTNAKSLGLQQDDMFCELKYEVKMVQQMVHTVLTRQQPVWETNNVAKYTSYANAKSNTRQSVGYHRHRCYAYGVNKVEAAEQDSQACQQLRTGAGCLTGISTSPLLSPGYTFELSQPVVEVGVASQMPGQFDKRTFVVTKINHKASDTESYNGTVEAVEVNITENHNDQTLITPFDMQSTQQGTILAKVLKTAVPKDWHYRNKNNFQTEMSSVSYAGDVERHIGCIGQFATDSGAAGATHWVGLSATSQNVPEVHAMVQIGRAGNESE
ncbi:MAG: hypothetical protein HRT35_33135, partial [Algicola sp.]|nr:hypothetical protein [Algicola sp.]